MEVFIFTVLLVKDIAAGFWFFFLSKRRKSTLLGKYGLYLLFEQSVE